MSISIALWGLHPDVICITLPPAPTLEELLGIDSRIVALLEEAAAPQFLLYDCLQLEDVPRDMIKYLGRVAHNAANFTHPKVRHTIVMGYSRLADTTTSVFFAMYPHREPQITLFATLEDTLAYLQTET